MRQPHIACLRNADALFGLWPWAQGPLFVLEEDHTFNVVMDYPPSGLRRFTIPRGYKFDGASIPAFLQRLFAAGGYAAYGLHITAALEHDFLCDLGHGSSPWLLERIGHVHPVPAKVTHAHFHRRLKDAGLRPSQAWLMGASVKTFGPKW